MTINAAPPLYAELIRRVREKAPLFERRVGGKASFAIASDAEKEGRDVDVPQAWVVPLAEVADRPSDLGEAQLVTERFAVIVCLSNGSARESGLGLIATDVLRAARQQLFNALLARRNDFAPAGDLNWLPKPVDGCRYVGARHLQQTRVRLWHQFDFEVAYYVSYDEIADTCIPLREAYMRLHPTGTPRPDGTDDFDLAYASLSPLVKETIGAGDTESAT